MPWKVTAQGFWVKHCFLCVSLWRDLPLVYLSHCKACAESVFITSVTNRSAPVVAEERLHLIYSSQSVLTALKPTKHNNFIEQYFTFSFKPTVSSVESLIPLVVSSRRAFSSQAVTPKTKTLRKIYIFCFK